MITKIRKRDGRLAQLNPEKISQAIFRAAQSAGGQNYEVSVDLADKVIELLEEKFVRKIPKVEDVQDTVEKVLIENGHAQTAKAYILYRADRTREREMNTKLMRTYEDLTFGGRDDLDLKRENANIDGDTAMGTMLRYGSEGAKQFNNLYLLDKEASEAHKSGDIHM